MTNDNVLFNNIVYLFSLPLLYAEIHYRFKYFFSWLKNSEPEIITDIPSRIMKGTKIPILVLVKDADKYPVEILEISVLESNRQLLTKQIQQSFSSPFEEIIFDLESQDLKIGTNYLNIFIRYSLNGKKKTCYNDNYPGTSQKPLPIYVSDSALPKLENCYYGETHYHSNYTSDQMEFGASLKSAAKLAQAMNISFVCTTDHSYDLDDEMDSYLINDPELKKWNQFCHEVEDFNNKSDGNFLIIPGEEATLRNKKDNNIHCLIYNSTNFFPGSGDSAEKWFKTFSELSIDDVLKQVDKDPLVFAAHPAEKPHFLQRFFLKRDRWFEEDCFDPRLNGIQFINGGDDLTVRDGTKFWIDLLLKGKKLIGLAGNDAHGNFARFRQVGFPFLKMCEHYWHLFGKWKTGIYLKNNKLSVSNILEMMKEGNCFMTNGPALQFRGWVNEKWQPMGGCYKNIKKLKVEALSTPEFSDINKIIIFSGFFDDHNENILQEKIFNQSTYHVEFDLDVPNQNKKGYLRMEVETRSGCKALSNPIWF